MNNTQNKERAFDAFFKLSLIMVLTPILTALLYHLTLFTISSFKPFSSDSPQNLERSSYLPSDDRQP